MVSTTSVNGQLDVTMSATKTIEETTRLTNSSLGLSLGQLSQLPPRDSIISDFVAAIIQLAVLVLLCGLVSTAGIAANITNIVIFFRQGALSSSSNLSLLTLAFVDIGCLLATLSNSVSFYIVKNSGLYVIAVHKKSTMLVHFMLVQTSGLVTAYIAFERCVSVVFPFTAKSLFSAKRTLKIMVTAVTVNCLSFVPSLATLQPEEVLYSDTNTTTFQVEFSEIHNQIFKMMANIHTLSLRTLIIFIVFICTQLTVFKIRQAGTWRKSIAASNQGTASKVSYAARTSHSTSPRGMESRDISHEPQRVDANATDKNQADHFNSNSGTDGDKVHQNPAVQRERRLVKLITTISAIFLVCNLPNIIIVFIVLLGPFFRDIPVNDNVFYLMVAIQYLFESINSSINIVAYYNLSTKYRQELLAWIGQCK